MRVLLIVLVAVSLLSCSAGNVSQIDPAPADFTLSILPETAVHGTSECTWDTVVEPTADGCIVSVTASGADGQKALYFDLSYDAEALHPVAAEPVEGVADCEPLSIAVLDDRGVVHYGMILPSPAKRTGFSGDGVVATVEFEYGAAECGRRVSGVPTDHYSSARLTNWNSPLLSWYATFSGDCNQDGSVTVTDLTPIGVNYQIANSPENFWMEFSELHEVDTDRNFEITVADITAIGRNYGKDIFGGFNVYASASHTDYPSSFDGPNGAGAELIGTALFHGDSQDAGHRASYSYEVQSPDPNLYYWVRPVDRLGIEGTPSRMIAQIGLNTSREDDGAAELVWDVENSNLIWGYGFPGDYNQDGWVTLFDMNRIGQFWGREGPFEIDSWEALIDANHDQVISVRDIYNIAIHFDRQYNGYRVFRSDDPADYPLFNDSQPVIEPYTDYTSASLDFDGPRNVHGWHIESPVSGMYYWVRLIDQNGYCGTPSNMIQIPQV